MDFFNPPAAVVDRQIMEGHRALGLELVRLDGKRVPLPAPTAASLRLHLKQFMPTKSSVSGSVTAVELRRLQSLHKQAVIETGKEYGIDLEEAAPPKVPSRAVRKRLDPSGNPA